MTSESEQAQSLSERAAREWYERTLEEGRQQAEKDGHHGSWDEFWMPIALDPVSAHEAGQAHGEKRGFYTAIARMESALQKISDEAKEKWPDCPDWWGVVWGMKAAIEEMKEQA